MKKLLSGLLIGLFVISIIGVAHSTPIDVEVLSSWYSQDLWIQARSLGGIPPTETLGYQRTSSSPLSERIEFNPALYAEGEAKDFSVYSSAWARNPSISTAYSISEASWLFSPTNEGNCLSFDFTFGGLGPSYTTTKISIEDLTNDTVILNLHLGVGGFPSQYGMPIDVEHFFNPESIYKLDLYTRAGANGDQSSVRVSARGIKSVPEPTTMLLFGTGLVGLAGARLRRKK